MSCCTYVTDMATFIHGNLGDSSLSIPSIQSKLVSNPYLGTLNNLLSTTCYSGVSGCITPTMGVDEQAIFASLYERDYYTTKLNQVLQGYGTSFTTLSEGDSRISRSSTADIARIYRDMQKQLNEQFTYLLNSYRQNEAQPRSVIYPTLVQAYGGDAGAGSWPQNYYRS